ncbi:MAG: SpoIIE family protein phosphatase [Verrucomicrobia bacterium]|nr:SpoIIE family protein phosphatase [Verrucomicrobiota bacterium]MDA1068281.1 SpoIIE family protein phosphatase [Verrucomicrobiota bacterium]
MKVPEQEDPELFSASASMLFDALLQQTQDQVYFKDRHSRFIRVSDSVAKKFGLGSAEEMIGKSDFNFFSEEHAQEAFQDEQRLMEKDERLINKTEKETWPDGSVTWVTSTKVPLHIGPGKPVGIMGITRDITERVQAEQALEESREQLRQKNEEMATDFKNAGRVQQRLIPGPLPEHSKVDLAVLNVSYSDVGGDVITFPLVSENYLSFLLGDVSGHGLSAGLFTILVKHLADFYMPSKFSHPEQALIELDQHMKGLIPSGFVAVMVGTFDFSELEFATLTLANAAQPPLLWFHESTGKADIVDCPSDNVIGLGICENVNVTKFTVDAGDCLLFMTDGLSECMNSEGVELGSEGLLEVFESCARKPMDEMVKTLEDFLKMYCGENYPQDDTTFLAIRVNL